MPTLQLWPGATTSTSIRVRGKISGASARLVVSTSADFANAVYYGPDTATSDSVVSFDATGLTPRTRYYMAFEIDSTELDTITTATARTFAPEGDPADFIMAMWSCQGLGPDYPGVGTVLPAERFSNTPHFLDVLAHDPDLVIQYGDLNYADPGSGVYTPDASVGTFRQMYDDVAAQPYWAQLLQSVPVIHQGDDHDGGPNNHDRTFEFLANYLQVYREREPSYALLAANNFQSWVNSRVQFVMFDCRSDRDPNSTTDSPDKTMLGAAQRFAFQQVLESSTAQALVILTPSAWLAPGVSDSWWGFSYEQQWVIGQINASRFAGKTVILQGDRHGCGIDSGTSSPGGYPVMQTAAMDSTPDAINTWFDMGPTIGGRGQYGTIQVADTGRRISITLTTWTALTPTYSLVVTMDAEDPTPPPPPAPVPVAQARIRSAVTWLGVHQTTGQIIAEIPDFTGEPERQLSAFATATMSVPLTSENPVSAQKTLAALQKIRACTDGRSAALVCVINDVPMWMGLPTGRELGSGENATIPTCTPEGYFVKRKVKDHSFAAVDRSWVAYQLALDAEQYFGQWQGLGLEYDIQLTGELIDIDYVATDRTSVYDALRALCEQGLEFEIAYDWTDNSQTQVTKILRIARRIGRVTAPQAMFDTDAGTALDWSERESWQVGNYASHITAIAPGQGDSQPASDPAIDTTILDAGAPVVELVIEPGNNITDHDLLNVHAQSALTRAQTGATVIEVEAPLHSYPRLGADCLLGDMASYRLYGPGQPKPGPPLEGERRIAGWKANPAKGIWTPKLVTDPSLDPVSTLALEEA